MAPSFKVNWSQMHTNVLGVDSHTPAACTKINPRGKVVPFVISFISEITHCLCRQARTQTRWLAHHQTIWCVINREKNTTYGHSQCALPWLWGIMIQQPRKARTSESDPLLCTCSWQLDQRLSYWRWTTTVAAGSRDSLSRRSSRHPRACVSPRVVNFLSAAPWSIFLLCEGIDSPRGRGDVSACMDQIDNAGLNLALRQESGSQAIFSCVYSWALPELNHQLKVRKWQNRL